jgi:hypothetical protein
MSHLKIIHVRIVGSGWLLRFKNAYRILIGKVGSLQSGMGNNIGMNVRRMADVPIWVRIVIVVGYGICGVVCVCVCVGSTGPSQSS